jgi:hypothetical protein
MSFREKSAWISFVLIFCAGSIYFAHVIGALITHTGYGRLVWLFVALVIGLVLLEVVLHTAIAVQAPGEARSPKDERERLIGMKATHIAFPVLLVGALCANLPMHFGGGRWEMSQAILFAVVVAELVRFGAQIVYYRRGV